MTQVLNLKPQRITLYSSIFLTTLLFINGSVSAQTDRGDRTSVFDKFTKFDPPGKGKYSSTGLGLQLVKIYTEKLGGTIVLKSEWGVGSTSTLKFSSIKCSFRNINPLNTL